MALFRACSNPQITRRLDAAIAAYERIMGSGLPAAEMPEAVPLGHRVLRRTILEVLEAAGEGLRVGEIQLRVEQQLGQPVPYHSLVASLSAGANDPKVPIIRVGRGRYRYQR